MKYLVYLLSFLSFVAFPVWVFNISPEEITDLKVAQFDNEELHTTCWQLMMTDGDIANVKDALVNSQFTFDSIYRLDLVVNGKVPYVAVFYPD